MQGGGTRGDGVNPASAMRRWGWMPPLVWVTLVMLLSANGLRSMAPFAFDTGLPEGVLGHVRTGIVVAMLNLFWGAWLLATAHARKAALRRRFILWQGFNLAAIAFSMLQTATTDAYVTTLSTFALPVAEFAIGTAMIIYARGLPDHAGNPPTAGADGLVLPARSRALAIVNGVIATVVGALVGGLAGLGLGIVSIDLFDVSCFEGACGYFAVALGLAGTFVGATAALLLTVTLARRRAR